MIPIGRENETRFPALHYSFFFDQTQKGFIPYTLFDAILLAIFRPYS